MSTIKQAHNGHVRTSKEASATQGVKCVNCGQRDCGDNYAGLGSFREHFGLVLHVGDATEGLLQKMDTIRFAL